MRKRLRKRLEGVLSSEDLTNIYNSYDIVGDIAVIKLPRVPPKNMQEAAKTIMCINKGVKTVLLQASPIAGQFRLRRLTHLAGENKTCTVHKESGCSFAVDVENCYFSPRLSHERLRIARLIQPNETLINMFAGVGCFSIIIAKQAQAARVFSIDVNPAAVQLMQENIRLNRVYGKVIPLLGDAKAVVENQLEGCADRVLMPLPEKAFEYLPCAISALKPSGGWIHYYDFVHAVKSENPAEKTKLRVAEKLVRLGAVFDLPSARVVRPTGPNWYQVVLDILVTRAR